MAGLRRGLSVASDTVAHTADGIVAAKHA